MSMFSMRRKKRRTSPLLTRSTSNRTNMSDGGYTGGMLASAYSSDAFTGDFTNLDYGTSSSSSDSGSSYSDSSSSYSDSGSFSGGDSGSF